jgi:hypothetical protein
MDPQLPPAKRLKSDEAPSATWPTIISPSLPLPARAIPVVVRVSADAAKWSEHRDNSIFFNVRLRTLKATDADVAAYPAHGAGIDIGAYSDMLSRQLSYQASDTLSAGSSSSGSACTTLSLDVHQRHLHTTIACLYSGSIELCPVSRAARQGRACLMMGLPDGPA